MYANMHGVRSTVSEDVGVVAAQTVAVVALTVPEAEVGDLAFVTTEDPLPANLMVGQAVVDTAGEVNVPVCNPTGGGIDAGAGVSFRVQLIKATGSV